MMTQGQFFAAIAGAGLISTGAAQAQLLNLTLENTPDILSLGIAVSYDAGTDAFSAVGLASSLDLDPLFGITDGAFDLQAQIDDTGALLGGTISISGMIAGLGYSSGTLLTGTLTDLGYNPAGGDPLEFTFEVTGGDAFGDFGAGQQTGGVILSQTGFDGDFSLSFDASFAVSDTGLLIPAPGVLAVIGLGAVSTTRRRRR